MSGTNPLAFPAGAPMPGSPAVQNAQAAFPPGKLFAHLAPKPVAFKKPVARMSRPKGGKGPHNGSA